MRCIQISFAGDILDSFERTERLGGKDWEGERETGLRGKQD